MPLSTRKWYATISTIHFQDFYFFIFRIFWLRWIVLAACRFPLVAASRGYSLVLVLRLLNVVASRVAGLGSCGLSSCSSRALEHRLNSCVAHRLSCSKLCGILLNRGLNPCFLHWQVDSSTLKDHRSSN